MHTTATTTTNLPRRPKPRVRQDHAGNDVITLVSRGETLVLLTPVP